MTTKLELQWFTFSELCQMLGRAHDAQAFETARLLLDELKSRASEAQFGR